jgi:ABC-2 type transport system ATP-binding protein
MGRKELRDLIVELKEEGKTVFFSSHILHDVELICDRVGLIIEGRLRDVGPLDELLGHEISATDVVAALPDGERGARLVKTLRELADSVRRQGSQAELRIEGEGDVEAVLRTILDGGGKIRSVTPRRLSLEEHFVLEARAAGKAEKGRAS